MYNQLGVIGCGLMGGSFALALKRAGLVKRIVGYSKSPSTTERAKKLGVIDAAAESALLAVSGSDIVLMAVPVSASESTFKAIRHLVEPGLLLMDVGSTKRDVVDAARRVLKERVSSFVPAHPIAGKEVAGVNHADATLYAGRQVILTPLPQTSPELVQKATDVWSAIGAQVLRMSPENHDSAFAAVSHLPHLLAFAGRTGFSGLHPHCRQRPTSVAGHLDVEPGRDPQAIAAIQAHPGRLGACDEVGQRRRTGRPGAQCVRGPRQLANGCAQSQQPQLNLRTSKPAAF
jgi:prephenate dehydrogenase